MNKLLHAIQSPLILCLLLLLPLSGAQQAAESNASRSIWDGVYTEAQAARGQFAYEGACSYCHGYRLDGAADDPDMRSSPPLARAKFLRNWEGRSLAVLYELTRTTMPEDNPGSLTEQEFIDVIAYMLSVSNMPPGERELEAELTKLAGIVITQSQRQ